MLVGEGGWKRGDNYIAQHHPLKDYKTVKIDTDSLHTGQTQLLKDAETVKRYISKLSFYDVFIMNISVGISYLPASSMYNCSSGRWIDDFLLEEVELAMKNLKTIKTSGDYNIFSEMMQEDKGR